MKIENGYNQYMNDVRQNKDHAQSKGLSPKIEPTEKEESVQVTISDAAKRLSQAKTTETRQADIEAIKKSVLDGTYSVSPEKIAKNMITAMNAQRK